MDNIEQFLLNHIGHVITKDMTDIILSKISVMSTDLSIFHSTPSHYQDNTYIVTNQSDRFIRWVADQCQSEPWSSAYGMGILNDNGEIIAGVVIEDYNGANACIHVAGIGGNWCNRRFLHAVFDYTFNQLQLKRLTGLVASTNIKALNLDIKLGFKIEHIIKNGHLDGDIIMLCMTKQDCKFLRGNYGQEE